MGQIWLTVDNKSDFVCVWLLLLSCVSVTTVAYIIHDKFRMSQSSQAQYQSIYHHLVLFFYHKVCQTLKLPLEMTLMSDAVIFQICKWDFAVFAIG